MATRPGTGRRRVAFVSLLVAAVAAVAAAGVGPASAVTIETEGPVFEEKCTPCHAEIAESKSSEIIFKHAYHILIACSSCHSSFPHRPEGTDRPLMRDCWNCHGLNHGPQGELATGECERCHRTPRHKLRPEFHTRDWAGEPHVVPGEEDLRTTCMMCHDERWCVDCHDDEDVEWVPDEPYTYDPGDGCLSCHADVNLTKISQGEPKSYQVTGIEDSAHRDLGCLECHPDFEYEDAAQPTPLWTVNASYACMGCHEDDEESVAGEEYRASVHGQALAAEEYNTATCSSCHGGHYIETLDTKAARDDFHRSAYRVCARCHDREWESYDDYYHGAAYKRSAPDAPACWECHGDHGILPSSDPSSTVSAQGMPETCGGGQSELACHEGATEEFTEAASDLIHQRAETREENALRKFFSGIFGWLP